jgi:hypothetical protein
MVRMKFSDNEFDEKELDVEYEGPKFERYTGDVPKTGTILNARVTKMWALVNEDGDQKTNILAVAEGNDGELKEFNGLPIWEYITWTPKNSRRYQPFLQNFGLTVRDYKRKLDVQPDDDNIGTPINSIAGWEPGSDAALCRIVIKRDFWNDEWRAKIDWDGWLEFDPDLYVEPGDEDEEDDEEPERPTRKRRAKSAASSKRGAATTSRRRGDPDEEEDEEDEYDDDVDDDEDIEDEEEEDDEDIEEEPAPARHRSSSRTARATARATARPASRASARGSRGGTASRSASKPARSRRGGSSGGSSDDPPF